MSTLNIVVEIVKRTDEVKGFKVLPRRWVAWNGLAGPQPPPGPWLRTAHRHLGSDDQGGDEPADARSSRAAAIALEP
ncbi:hypothetical protein [Streptomyces sp. NPDC048473]|uniref:hypothetical protein n=1 Tax=Streptomyces sp. NPDC048473 TaxID=3365556 RepID=UPI003721B834